MSPGRHVRTRLYFTSESHVHSLLNIFRYGGLLDVSKQTSNMHMMPRIMYNAGYYLFYLICVCLGAKRRTVEAGYGLPQRCNRTQLYDTDCYYAV